jgi:hypothetical protein
MQYKYHREHRVMGEYRELTEKWMVLDQATNNGGVLLSRRPDGRGNHPQPLLRKGGELTANTSRESFEGYNK